MKLAPVQFNFFASLFPILLEFVWFIVVTARKLCCVQIRLDSWLLSVCANKWWIVKGVHDWLLRHILHCIIVFYQGGDSDK